MSGLKIGYARVSTDAQDLTAQRDALDALGVEPDRVYVSPRRSRPDSRDVSRAGSDERGRLVASVLATVSKGVWDLTTGASYEPAPALAPART